MDGISEIGAVVLSRSEQKLELISQNIANVNTPGFRSLNSFSETLAAKSEMVSNIFQSTDDIGMVETVRSDVSGDLTVTDRNFDMALSGAGVFRVKDGETDVVYETRDGRFERDEDGYVVDMSGRNLLSVEGRNVRTMTLDVIVETDGTIFEEGRPVDRIGVFADGTSETGRLGDLLSREDIRIRQGMLETSNVALADQMVSMMEAVREAEVGSRILQTYDTLMGRAISAFGGS